MFTGFDSDPADAFSFVILTDVVAGTVIYITDRGWSNTGGYRNTTNGEGTISFTFNSDYPCGTSVIFTDIGGANDWQARDVYGIVIGTVVIQAGQDGDGMEFGTELSGNPTGDQLSIYQLPEPTAANQTSFVTMIQMDNSYMAPLDNNDESQMPTGLAANTVVRFNNEVDNAKYDCSPNTGSATTLRTAITNDNGAGGLIVDGSNNWDESNNYISLFPACNFCCGTTPPAGPPVLSGPTAVNTNQVFTINITGTLASGAHWELYTAGCGEGTPLQTTTSSSFTITAPATEGQVIYYIRTSQQVDCEAICATLQVGVCINVNNMNTCTNCSADMLVCGDCFLPPALDNPDLDSGCYQQKIIMILDESGSIFSPVNYQDSVEFGVLAFLNALNGQDIEIAIIEFGSSARLVAGYTTISNGFIMSMQGYFNGVPFNGQTYSSSGGTNWHDAMDEADQLPIADMIMFFTDGEPTGWGLNGTFNTCGDGTSTQPPEIVNPVKLANKFKGEGTHMFMLGVGSGIVQLNLQRMSGLTEYMSGINTMGTSDYSIGNFGDLADDLEAFVEELCVTPLQLDKQLFGAVCDGVQQFRFILYNPGTESAATYIVTDDEFPSGYTNVTYNGPPFTKVKVNAACQDFPEQGYPPHTNGFRWVISSLPPGARDTLDISVTVLGSGNYDNHAQALGNNTALAQDSVINPVFVVDDIPPTIACPGNVLLDCTESTLPAYTGTATASDPDGSSPEVTYNDITVAGPCPESYIINRTWLTTDGCTNTAFCLQVINVDEIAPQIENCAVTRNVEGCSTSSITGPNFSATSAASSIAVFEDATNQGSISTICGTGTVTYMDVATGTCPIVVTRTWSVTDLCGNTVSCAQTINVDDNGSPSIATCPVARTIEGCNTSAITGPAYSTTTASSTEAEFENGTNQGNTSDGCGVSGVTYIDVASGTCPTVVTRKWTVSDACGNTSTCNQIINLDDTVLPAVTACAVTRNIEGCGTAAITGPVYSATSVASTESVFENATNLGNISDACGITGVTYIDVATGTCPTVVTRTWTITDACSNVSTCNQTINVDDNILPAVTTCAATRNVSGCGTSAITGPDYSATTAISSEAVFENATNLGAVSDACGITAVTYIDVAAGTCPTVVTRTWTITDGCGNSATCNQTININDLAPTISTCAAVRNIEGCNTSAITGPAFSTTSAVSSEAEFENATNLGNATDACGITAVTYIDVASGTCPTVVTRKWTVTDVCGNTATCNQTINVDDNGPPMIAACAVTRNIEGCNTSAITGPVYSTVTTSSTEGVFEDATNQGNTSDLCGITTVTYRDVASGTCPIVVTRTWTITDACGNSTVCNQTINVDDTVSPLISGCAVPRTIEGCSTAAITGPAYSVISATSSESVFENVTNQGNATDACGITNVTYIDVATGTCPTVVTRTWTITDACGNTSTCNQTITVDDTVSPLITTCPSTRNIEGCSTAAITGPTYSTVTASSIESVFENGVNQGNTSDLCGVTAVTYIDVASGSCPIIVTRTWTVSDACGNTTTCVQTINVDDTVSPSITTCPVTRNIEGCNTSAITDPAFSSTSATASESVFENATNLGITSDECGIASVNYIDVANGSCPIVVTRTWTIGDACGNVTTCTQTINVDDTTSPVLTCPANVTIECTAVTLPSNTGSETVSDNCDASPVVTYADVTAESGTCPQEYSITRTWTATDVCGNSSTCIQEITIDDSLPPVIVCPADITIECIENTLPANTGSATASDNCDGDPSVNYADVTMAVPPTHGYLIERTWTTTDICGNVATCLQTISVVNPLDPELLGDPFDTICSGDLVVFEAFDQGINPITYDWSFGSGAAPGMQTGIGPHSVQYTYNATNGSVGAWVILTVGTPGCESVTDTVANVHVNAIPNATISASPGNPCILGPKTFQPVAAQMPGFSYSWNFGSGANMPTATTYGPHTIEYFTAGSKTVQLIVFSNADGASCGDTSTLTFGVNPCFGNITGKVMNINNSPINSVNLRLYADQNLDGIQDTTIAIKSVFSNSSGLFSMATVTPGYYVIVEVQPSGYISISDEDTTNDHDSIPNTNMNNNIIPVTVEPLEIDADNVFVEANAPGIITGYVFEDFNNDQNPAPIEGLPDVTIKLYTDTDLNGVADIGGLVTSATTSSSGYYTIPDIPAGSYVIIELQPADYTSVKDIDVSNDGDAVPNTNLVNDTIPVTLINGETDEGNYFIESSTCSRMVTNSQDNGPGSLRYMIDCSSEGDTIFFHPLLANQTLILNSGRIEFDKNLYLHSDVMPRLMIQSNVSGGFKVLPNKEVEFKNLNITSGLAGYPGAAFDNYGRLILWDVFVYRNSLLPVTEYLIFNGADGILTAKGTIEINNDQHLSLLSRLANFLLDCRGK